MMPITTTVNKTHFILTPVGGQGAPGGPFGPALRRQATLHLTPFMTL